MKRPRARRAGFTLVELLVAIGILALVAVLGWRGLDGIVRARVALTGQMEQTRGMQLAFAQMQSDAEHLAEVEQLRGRSNLEGGADRLTLVRTVFEENQPARLQVVSYRVRNGVLTRQESAATRDLIELDTLWRAALGQADGGAGVALQADVESMAVRLWREGAWRAPAGDASAPPPPGPGGSQTGPAGSSGLEVSLRLRGQEIALTKAFLLGAI